MAGMILLILSVGFGLASIIYSILRDGIIAGFSTALKAAAWIILSLILMALGETTALLISIERGIRSLVDEIQKLQVRPVVRESEDETIFDEFGIEIAERGE